MDPIRSDRLKAALRENLKRRKAQLRAREGGQGEGGEHEAAEVQGGERVKNTTPDEDVTGAPEHGSKGNDR